jgi:hypothetical protein
MLVAEKRPVIPHSQRFFRVPFTKAEERVNNNNTGDQSKVRVAMNKISASNNGSKITFLFRQISPFLVLCLCWTVI